MEPISLIMGLGQLLSHLPVADLAIHGVDADSSAGFLYDVAQAMLGMKLIATLADKLARKTPWTWDDGYAKGFLSFTTRASAWLTGLASTPKKGK